MVNMKLPKKPEQKGKTGNIVSLGTIEDYCRNNTDFEQLLIFFRNQMMNIWKRWSMKLKMLMIQSAGCQGEK